MARYGSCEEYVLQQLEEKEKECEALKRNYAELEDQFNFADNKLNEVLGLLKDFARLVEIKPSENDTAKGMVYVDGTFVAFIWHNETKYEPLIKLLEIVNAIPSREQ